MKKIIWHLPYGMIGGVETLYATILKFMRKYPDLEHFITCHTNIQSWVQSKYNGLGRVFPFSDPLSLQNAIKTVDPDLIMGTHGMTLYQALEGIRAYPVIEIVHGSHVWVEHNVYMPKTWTEHVVCVSKSAERNYLSNTNCEIGTSIIINGVDTSIFYPRKPFQRVAKNIGYFGRFLEGDKHLTKMIMAFKSLGQQSAKLYLIGGNPVEIATLKRFASREKILNAVKFYGHARHPEKFYEELDMCTVRSEAEGYCNSAAEALACGTPLVCYNFGGILEHAPKGSIQIADNQASYAAALNTVYRDVELRQSMRELGLQFVQAEGNAQVMADSYYKLITDFLGKGITSRPKVKKSTREVSIPYVGAVTERIKSTSLSNVVSVFTPHWHGIATATQEIAPNSVPWESSHKSLVNKILKKNPTVVLFSGMPGGFQEAATLLRKRAPNLPIMSYYHGGYSHYSFSGGIFGAGERNAFETIVDLTKKGIFNKVAVSSPGMAEVGRSNGLPFEFCGNVVEPKEFPQIPPLPGIHIGNWNRHLDHKHTSIGVAASNLIVDAKVHMLECPYRIPSLDYNGVTFYKEMGQKELYKMYRKMTVNLQLSFIETFNISVLEMWACGVPVLMGPGCKVLVQGNPYLEQFCYIDDHTNPVRVASKIEEISHARDDIVTESYRWLQKLNGETRERWRNFFS